MMSRNIRLEQIRQWIVQNALDEAKLRDERQILEQTLEQLANLYGIQQSPSLEGKPSNREKVIALHERVHA